MLLNARQNTLTQCVFKVSAFDFNACKKTCAPHSNCRWSISSRY